FVCAEARRTPGAQLRQRHAVLFSSAEIHDPRLRGTGCDELLLQSAEKVVWVKAIPQLMSRAIEADVFKRRAPQIGIDPVRENSLVGAAELPSPGQDAAAIDPDRELECLAVFQSHAFRCEFRASVKRNGWRAGKIFGDPLRTGAGRKQTGMVRFERVGI